MSFSLRRKRQRSMSDQGLQRFANDKSRKEKREKHDQPHQTTYSQVRLFWEIHQQFNIFMFVSFPFYYNNKVPLCLSQVASQRKLLQVQLHFIVHIIQENGFFKYLYLFANSAYLAYSSTTWHGPRQNCKHCNNFSLSWLFVQMSKIYLFTNYI